MFRTRALPVLAAATGCWAIIAASASAEGPATVSVQPELGYNVTTLTIKGSAACDGGGTAGITVVDGSLEQMFRGGVGGPMGIQLDGPVRVGCDGAPHSWEGHLIAPGRVLPNESGGSVTVTLSQGPSVLASTGPQPVRIVT
ncbi:hypothetical protein [Nocardia sp. NPDC051570]|uniref:hypothetical protein n=1 Tax=Nocardia sp. NPDC051570 TaxID=3364324 RepID=UPI0037A51625